ncbi:hypothetical protein HZA97_08055 [Candidatus Woesearchaeota archaeon]|nr:hypothetical protein [Candidatus Woesearchaeota archaeon]
MIAKTKVLTESENEMFASQAEFTRRANDKGVLIASMPDIYYAAKVGTDEDLLNGLKLDFNKDLVTSTRIKRKGSILKITHYHGSKVISPSEKEVALPAEKGWIKQLDSEMILEFTQALFNTKDSAEEIRNSLEKLTENKLELISLKLPNQYQVERAVSITTKINGRLIFNCNKELNCYYESAHKGYAREVVGEPAGLEQKLRTNSHKGINFSLNSEVDQENNCVYFTNAQRIGNFTKYSGMFCFKGERYVVLITSKQEINEASKLLSRVFASQKLVKEKVEELGSLFSPVYLHLERYVEGKGEYKQADDLEIFGGI